MRESEDMLTLVRATGGHSGEPDVWEGGWTS
jgi:hypothetical protein